MPARAIPNADMFFQHCSDKLRVLKLSRCTFSIQSPPFLCCHGLRFLWLDNCQDTGNNTDGARMEEDARRCFQRLWVLDVRYTNCDQILSAQTLDLMTQLRELVVMGAQGWDMGQLHGRLPSIRKLRITNSKVSCSTCSANDLLSEMNKMELLDFSGNTTDSSMKTLSGPGAISNSSFLLETVIVNDGSVGLEHISFSGCTKLKNLFLRGFMRDLRTLDISGTTVKTIDLTATTVWHLAELYLFGCENLRSITWPAKNEMGGLSKLCIDTTQSAPSVQSKEETAKRDSTTASTGTSEAAAVLLHGSRPISEFPWYISVRDARLLTSLEPVCSDSRKIFVEVYSPTSPTIAAPGGCKDEGIESGGSSDQQQVLVSLQRQQTAPATAMYTADSTMNHLKQASEGDGDDALGIMWMWPCPDVPDLPQESCCYMHIQDRMGTKQGGEGTSSTTITVPEFVLAHAKILHVHDSLSITTIPSATTEWEELEWCRIERCPRVGSVFATLSKNISYIFRYKLRMFWASHLPKARYIWSLSEESGYCRTFSDLTLLHLDCCPRLVHVLPLSCAMMDPAYSSRGMSSSLSQLDTLEITWCGDLREVFPLDKYAKEYVKQKQQQQPVVLDFPCLKRIHLHELPSLQRICGLWG
ncbi:hypothetical protein C2845_PM03G21760 [Panicum miliaceum]|uniref:Uncharacterized protein n=1 Tax=Panicum miliaceum TaxID=4540 RepID=A0A3L6TCN5_PANMI|nr:hypothetical protein C2845_PM03G21760 [Panicum miliaceum]